MPKSVTREERASETITMRLTRGQKRLLARIAEVSGSTATDVLRDHIIARSRELGLSDAGSSEAVFEAPAIAAAPAPAPLDFAAAEIPSAVRPGTFEELAARYRAAFVDRGEGTQRELAEAIAFLTDSADPSGRPILPGDLLLAELGPARLATLREAVCRSGLRLSRKNLYLTYFRMMLHFAQKQKELPADVNPGEDLRAFTATEAGESWVPPPIDIR